MQRRGLLLDRDGIINRDHGYVGQIGQFEFIPEVFPILRAAQDRGFCLAILTNQSGVARGHYTEQDFWDLTAWMHREFGKQGIAIDLVLASFEHGEGEVATYRRDSFWRKPNPGMILEAVQRLHLDPTRSIFLGDQKRDMEAALAGGIKTCLWLTEEKQTMPGATVISGYDNVLAYFNT